MRERHATGSRTQTAVDTPGPTLARPVAADCGLADVDAATPTLPQLDPAGDVRSDQPDDDAARRRAAAVTTRYRQLIRFASSKRRAQRPQDIGFVG